MAIVDSEKYKDEKGIMLNKAPKEFQVTVGHLSHTDAVRRANRQGARARRYIRQLNTSGHSNIDGLLASEDLHVQRYLVERLGVFGVIAVKDAQPKKSPNR